MRRKGALTVWSNSSDQTGFQDADLDADATIIGPGDALHGSHVCHEHRSNSRRPSFATALILPSESGGACPHLFFCSCARTLPLPSDYRRSSVVLSAARRFRFGIKRNMPFQTQPEQQTRIQTMETPKITLNSQPRRQKIACRVQDFQVASRDRGRDYCARATAQRTCHEPVHRRGRDHRPARCGSVSIQRSSAEGMFDFRHKNSKYDNLAAFVVLLFSSLSPNTTAAVSVSGVCTRKGLAAAATRSYSTSPLGRRVEAHSMCRQRFALNCFFELLLVQDILKKMKNRHVCHVTATLRHVTLSQVAPNGGHTAAVTPDVHPPTAAVDTFTRNGFTCRTRVTQGRRGIARKVGFL